MKEYRYLNLLIVYPNGDYVVTGVAIDLLDDCLESHGATRDMVTVLPDNPMEMYVFLGLMGIEL